MNSAIYLKDLRKSLSPLFHRPYFVEHSLSFSSLNSVQTLELSNKQLLEIKIQKDIYTIIENTVN